MLPVSRAFNRAISLGYPRNGGIKMKQLLAFILLIVLVAIPLRAEKYALLVGINDYQNDIGALKYCVADVAAFRNALVEMAGYRPENVHLMTDQMSVRDLPAANHVILRLANLAAQVQP